MTLNIKTIIKYCLNVTTKYTIPFVIRPADLKYNHINYYLYLCKLIFQIKYKMK